jgi:hypothetical protein
VEKQTGAAGMQHVRIAYGQGVVLVTLSDLEKGEMATIRLTPVEARGVADVLFKTACDADAKTAG